MTQMIRTLRPLTLIAVLALSSAAFAGGTHGGGHGHDSDETAIGKPGVAVAAITVMELGVWVEQTPVELQEAQVRLAAQWLLLKAAVAR